MPVTTFAESHLGKLINSSINQNRTPSVDWLMRQYLTLDTSSVGNWMDLSVEFWNDQMALIKDHSLVDGENLPYYKSLFVQASFREVNLKVASLVAAITERQKCGSAVVTSLRQGKEKEINAARAEAKAKGKAVAKGLHRKETKEVFVSVNSSQSIPWDQALEIAEEGERMWEVVLFNAQTLSRAIHKTCQAIHLFVSTTDNIIEDYSKSCLTYCRLPQLLGMDKYIAKVDKAFTIVSQKVANVLEARKKAPWAYFCPEGLTLFGDSL
jgi:hypothetical protein